MLGKSIRIYLADGTPSGIRHAELINWTGQAIVCPRGRLGELSTWDESQRPGVYVLFGDNEAGDAAAYIGEAENVLTRLQSHVKNKDFWTRTVFFTSKDDNLTKSHVKYVESRLVDLARKAERYALENGNTPTAPALPRAERDAMEEFLGPLQVLLGTLGFPLLQPVAPIHLVGEVSTNPIADVRLSFVLTTRNVEATGASGDEGFVVFEGSMGTAEERDSLGKGYRALRHELLAEGTMVTEGVRVRFTRDQLFSSPSAAASVLCGGAFNGREAWKDRDGVSLKQLEERAVEA